MKNFIKLFTHTFLVTTISAFSSNEVIAQDILNVEDMNSVYKKELTLNKKVQSYAPLREADVMWLSLIHI